MVQEVMGSWPLPTTGQQLSQPLCQPQVTPTSPLTPFAVVVPPVLETNHIQCRCQHRGVQCVLPDARSLGSPALRADQS